jgi:hypothetical protein
MLADCGDQLKNKLCTELSTFVNNFILNRIGFFEIVSCHNSILLPAYKPICAPNPQAHGLLKNPFRLLGYDPVLTERK